MFEQVYISETDAAVKSHWNDNLQGYEAVENHHLLC